MLDSVSGKKMEHLKKIFRELNLDADLEYICIDSTAVKAHESANGGVKKGNPKQ